MSDQKPANDETKNAEPIGKAVPQPGAGTLEARPMTFSQQLFLWTMVVLVGGVFGVGSSMGLMFASRQPISSYQVDPLVVERRQRTAATLESAIYGRQSSRKTPEQFALEYRLAEYADDQGLKPTGPTLDRLADEFLGRTINGRTYGDKLRDNKSGSTLAVEDLHMYLAESFAIQAWASREIMPPVMPRTMAGLVSAIYGDQVPTDEVVLTATPLLTEVAMDDPGLQADYELLVAQGRFQKPAMLVLQVAHADLAPLIAAQVIDDAAIATYYEAHPAEFLKVSEVPDQGQTAPAPERRPLDEVKDEIRAKLARQAALAIVGARVVAFDQTVVDQGLEEKDAAAYAEAAKTHELIITEVEIEEQAATAIELGPLGPLGRTARDLGLTAGKPGNFISDRQQTVSGDWVLIRYASRLAESRKTLQDEEVSTAVRRHLAGKRAYAALLTEAEALRVRAQEAGSLRAVLADAAVATRWSAEVVRRQRRSIEPLLAPEPAEDEGVLRPEPRIAASLAVAGNPVTLVAEAPDQDVPRVRLVQCAGYKPAEALKPEDLSRYAEAGRGQIKEVLQNQAYAALQRQLEE